MSNERSQSTKPDWRCFACGIMAGWPLGAFIAHFFTVWLMTGHL